MFLSRLLRIQSASDFNPTGLADGDVPTFNTASGKFTAEPGGGSGPAYASLTDISAQTVNNGITKVLDLVGITELTPSVGVSVDGMDSTLLVFENPGVYYVEFHTELVIATGLDQGGLVMTIGANTAIVGPPDVTVWTTLTDVPPTGSTNGGIVVTDAVNQNINFQISWNGAQDADTTLVSISVHQIA